LLLAPVKHQRAQCTVSGIASHAVFRILLSLPIIYDVIPIA
jgi:hypothetical protein